MALDRIEVKNPVGVNTSVNSGDLPLEVWSDGNNISFKDGKTTKVQGMSPVFGVAGPVLGLQPFLSNDIPYWILGDATDLYRTEGGTPISVSGTSAPYSASLDSPWNGGVLHKVSVMNNGVDVPQVLLPSGSFYQDLPAWPANTSCEVLRPFKNYLIALNVTKAGVGFPTLVKWSSPADPGQVPFTWDETDPINEAGETSLADTTGAIVDGVKLRDSFIIYKEDSSYLMRYIGGIYIFAFQQLFNDIGMLAKNCAAEFNGFHFVVGAGDIYVHNGVQKRSVIDGKAREALFSSINPDYYKRVFVIPDYTRTEMWICYPSIDSVDGSCDKAMVWNWTNETWAPRDIPGIFCGAVGIVDPQVPDYWEADTNAWATDTSVWASSSYNASKVSILLASTLYEKIYVVDEESLIDGNPFTSFLERTSMYLGDNRSMKSIHSVIPHMSGSGTCLIYVGTSQTLDGSITWKGPYYFDIATGYKVDCKKVGRYVSVRFEFPSQGSWTLNGYTVEFTPTAGIR